MENNQESGKQTREVFDAIELLMSLGEFSQFKSLMLEKKALKNQSGQTGLQIIDKGVLTVDSIPEYMERLSILRDEANASDGWV